MTRVERALAATEAAKAAVRPGELWTDRAWWDALGELFKARLEGE